MFFFFFFFFASFLSHYAEKTNTPPSRSKGLHKVLLTSDSSIVSAEDMRHRCIKLNGENLLVCRFPSPMLEYGDVICLVFIHLRGNNVDGSTDPHTHILNMANT